MRVGDAIEILNKMKESKGIDAKGPVMVVIADPYGIQADT